jgi:hypothetical protein
MTEGQRLAMMQGMVNLAVQRALSLAAKQQRQTEQQREQEQALAAELRQHAQECYLAGGGSAEDFEAAWPAIYADLMRARERKKELRKLLRATTGSYRF